MRLSSLVPGPRDIALILLFLLLGRTLPAGDCNENGVEDRLDVLPQLSPRLPLRLPGGSVPGSVEAADLDGDQNPDLVVTNFLSLLIFSRQGSEDFRQTGEIKLDLSPTGLLVRDLDGDGSQDLLATAVNGQAPHADMGVFVILNRGDGTFEAPLKLLPEGGPHSPAVLDLDDDGDLDVAAANYLGGSVSVFRNQGAEGFTAGENIPVGSIPGSLNAADLDGDGRQELVLLAGSPLRRVVLLAEKGEAGFAEPRDLYSREGIFDLRPADLDGDGLEDLILPSLEESRMNLLLNLGGGGFAAPREFPAPPGPAVILPADLNGDGSSDLAVLAPTGGSLSIMLNSAGGSFDESRDYYVGRLSGAPFASVDLDGDGDLDLATTTAESVVLLENVADGRLAAPAIVRGVVERAGLVRGADLDGDGDVDLAVVQSDATRRGYVSILLNDGQGAFTAGVEVPAPEQLAKVDLFDVDGDGDSDLLVGQRSGFVGLVTYLNHGDATFNAPLNSVSTGYLSSFSFADFDGDSWADLAIPIEFPVGVKILSNPGGGSFESATTLSWFQKVFSPPVFISAADFTGDGLADIIVGPYDDLPARLYVSRGDLSFAVPVPLDGVSFSYHVASADLDRDGDLDLVAANTLSLSLYLNDGAGHFAAPVEYPTPAITLALEVADVDGDRDQDILLALAEGDLPPDIVEGELRILVNDGRGGFSRTLSFHPGFRPADWVLADFDGDGGKDLTVLNEGRRQVSPGFLSFLNRLTIPPSSADDDADGNPDECQSLPFHRGDANVDGDLDVSDGLCVLQFLFTGGRPLTCLEAADSNNDGSIDCTDAIFTLAYLFLGSEPPADPGPPHFGRACGSDPDLLGAPGYLGCEGYRFCGPAG